MVTRPMKAPETDTPVLIFIHVPKTAGTSFYNLIEANYEPGSRFVFNINKGKNPIPRLMKQLRKRSIKAIYGHGTFGLRELCPRAKYVTFVRHPVSHTLSNYHYIRTSPHNRFHKQVRGMSFSEFILSLADLRQDNLHYRQLTNTLFRIEHPEFYSRKIVPDYHQLDYALGSIDHIYRFDELALAVEDMAAQFNWQHTQLGHLNASNKKDTIVSEEDLHNILSINALDWHIYRRSVSLGQDDRPA